MQQRWKLFFHFIYLLCKARTPVGVRKYFVPAAIGDEMELRSMSSPIAAGSSSCLTYTFAVYAVFVYSSREVLPNVEYLSEIVKPR